jgi:hypothetical protein
VNDPEPDPSSIPDAEPDSVPDPKALRDNPHPPPGWMDPASRANAVPPGTPYKCDLHIVIREIPTPDFCEQRFGRPDVVYLREEVSTAIMNAIETAIGTGYEFVVDIQFPVAG